MTGDIMVPTSNEHQTKTPSSDSAGTENRRKSDAGPSELKKDGVQGRKDGVQGEGNYEAAREFNEAERKFVASGKVAAAARAAAPKSEAERQEMMAAEREGKRRAKEEDPARTKAWPDSAGSGVLGKDAERKRG
jgi:hypothetical protein